jgi:hypothetical protein
MLFLMLPENFKEDVLEIIAITRQCPDALQEKCFVLLLENYLKKPTGKSHSFERHETSTNPPTPLAADREESTADTSPQRDLVLADLSLKAKRFLEKYARTIDDVNQLFFKEGDEIKPLYDDLKTTKLSESQVRVALLFALRSGLEDGEFQFDGEKVREECQLRKAYDATNFAANFKNSASLFDNFEKYEKSSPVVKLSEPGRKRLAELMIELK